MEVRERTILKVRLTNFLNVSITFKDDSNIIVGKDDVEEAFGYELDILGLFLLSGATCVTSGDNLVSIYFEIHYDNRARYFAERYKPLITTCEYCMMIGGDHAKRCPNNIINTDVVNYRSDQ